MRSRTFIVAVLLALAGLPSLAHAAGTADVSGGVLTFTATAGDEDDQIGVSQNVAAGPVDIVDQLAEPITPGPGCIQGAQPHTVTCSGVTAITLNLDAGDDIANVFVTDAIPVTANGATGNDLIATSIGADTLNGGAGDDSLQPGAGNDQLNGDTHATLGDSVFYSERTVAVTVDLANDTAGELSETDTLSGIENGAGGSQGDTLTGDGGDNRLFGGEGVDTIAAGGGDDVVSGGPGNDDLDGEGHGTAGDTVDYSYIPGTYLVGVDLPNDSGSAPDFGFGPDTDSIPGFENAIADGAIAGDGGPNRLSAVPGSSGGVNCSGIGVLFTGGGGDDVLVGTGGIDTLNGEGDDDELRGGDECDTLIGGSGDDDLDGEGGDDSLSGGTGGDLIAGGSENDTAAYGDHTAADPVNVSLDTVRNDGEVGASGFDGPLGDDVANDVETVAGTPGNDTLIGNDQVNTLDGEFGDDRLEGRGQDDRLDGCDGADTVLGEGGDDTLVPGEGLPGAGHGDDYDGGSGRDTIDYSLHFGVLITVTIDAGTDDDGLAGEGDDVDAVEIVRADATTVQVTGTGGDETVFGGAGNDTFTGAGGDDRFVSKDAPDGPDTFNGGTGTDTMDYSARAAVVTADLDGVADDGAISEDDLVGSDVEGLIGGAGNDQLTGNGNPNVLDGGLGGDVLRGGPIGSVDPGDVVDYSSRAVNVNVDLATTGGDGQIGENDVVDRTIEEVLGGTGNDTLYGNDRVNALDGGEGDDTIFGGPGADVLAGGADDDSIDAQDVSIDTVDCGTDADTVSVDAVDVRTNCETVSVEGDDDNLAPRAALAGPSTADVGANVAFSAAGSDDDDGVVDHYEWDLDGDGAFELNTGTTTSAARSYPTAGARTVRLRVVDDGGAATVATRSITVGTESPPGNGGGGGDGGGAQAGGAAAPQGTSSIPGPPASRPPTASRDTTPPTATLARLASIRLAALLRRGLQLRLTCAEPCSITASLLLDGRGARAAQRRSTVGRASARLTRAGTASIRLRPSAAGRRRLQRRRSARLIVRVVVTDAAGNARRIDRRLTVRR